MRIIYFLKITWILLAEVFFLNSNSSAQITPTYQWVNFYGENSLLGGLPLPIGAKIEAFDPDSVLCGEFIVSKQGEYGFLAVYRDDPFTIEMDEGAVSGDTITFMINGMQASALGPNSPVWTANGDSRQVELSAGKITDVSKDDFTGIPVYFSLKAFPNPAYSHVKIVIDTAVRSADVKINIYDIKGTLVNQISQSALQNRNYAIFWDGKDRKGQKLPTGLYFIDAIIRTKYLHQRKSSKLLILR